MYFSQIFTKDLAHCSYLIGRKEKCMVVDPNRDVRKYIRQAEYNGMEIVGVLMTHLHADFISGNIELKDKIGAEVYAPAEAECEFEHHPLNDGDELIIENIKLKFIETPGHTPDSSIIVVTDLEKGDEPVLAFTGDTLLVGDVGRPYMFPEIEEELVESLFESLKKLEGLPDNCEIYPTHGMGSLFGITLSSKLSSTMGTERKYNKILKCNSVEELKEELLVEMPPVPDHFSRCTEMNRQGPELIKSLPVPQPMDPSDIQEAMNKGKVVLDTRKNLSFAAAHIPKTINITNDWDLSKYAGWIIPPDDGIVLVMDDESDLDKIRKRLYYAGLDRIEGYLKGGIEKWINKGLPVDYIETMSVHRLHEWLKEDYPLILDNRKSSEWEMGYVPGSRLAPAPDVRFLYEEWSQDKLVVTLCNISKRSMMAASILKQKDFKRVINIVGGVTAWKNAGYELQYIEDEESIGELNY